MNASEFARRGVLYVTTNSHAFLPADPADGLSVRRYGNATRFESSAAGTAGVYAPISLPTAADGKRLSLLGAEYCYTASAGAPLTNVSLLLSSATSGGHATMLASASDETDRTDAACRTLSLSPPRTLEHADQLAMYMNANYSAASTYFYPGRVTVFLDPSTSDAKPAP